MLAQLYQKYVIFPLASKGKPLCKWRGYTLEKKIEESRLKNCSFFGFSCGHGGVEVIDVDNHFGDADELFSFIYNNFDITNCPIVKTGGGGYHIYIRSDNPSPQTKFATRELVENDESKHIIRKDKDKENRYILLPNGDETLLLYNLEAKEWRYRSTLVENRSLGGYVICPPTKGYTLENGNLLDIPFFTESQRDSLIHTCRALNEVFDTETVKKGNVANYSDEKKPGDVYIQDAATCFSETTWLLRNEGWQSNDDKHWVRPGKKLKQGISATLGKCGNLFYVFSSNAHPFEDRKHYDPFAVRAFISHGGDFGACAKELAVKYGISHETKENKALPKKKEAIKPATTPKKEKKTFSNDDAEDYIRVGDTYFKKVEVFDKSGNQKSRISKRARQTIIDDHGKYILEDIEKFDEFINTPSHEDYKPKIGLCYNVYNKVVVSPASKSGDWSTIRGFFQHIFEEHEQMGYDYIKILWEEPTQILPILCLVSEEQSTGKSTFGDLLELIFSNNYCNIGQNELNTEFNGSYSTKLACMVDESYINYKVIDKLKYMATAKTIQLRQMHRDHISIDFFCKFILCSNRINDFIIATEKDQRYWVRKINIPKSFDPNFLKNMEDEIPAFLEFIKSREFHKKNTSRMWFSYEDIRTDAFYNVIRASKDIATKDFMLQLLAEMEAIGTDEIQATPKDLKEKFFDRRNDITGTKIKDILQEQMNLKPKPSPSRYVFLDGTATRSGRYYNIHIDELKTQLDVTYDNNVIEDPVSIIKNELDLDFIKENEEGDSLPF